MELLNHLDFGYTLHELGPLLMKALGLVGEAVIFGYLLGFILALLFAFARISKKHKIIKALVTLLIEVIRGTPLLVQLVYMYYVVPLLIQLVLSWFGINSQIEMTAMTAGVIGLGIHYGCYMSEVIRSAIESIDIGQTEAALALGFSEKQALFGVVVPQALKNSLPVFGNYLVMIVKDTSLLSYVALPEMLLITKTFASQTFHTIEGYTLLAGVYLLISVPLSLIVKYIEKRMKLGQV